MSFSAFCEWLSQTPLSIYLRFAPYPFPILIIIHIFTIALFAGMTIIGNLRVLGWTLRSVPVSQVINPFRIWKWAALAILLATGLLMAISDPEEYRTNIMFWISLVVLVLAGWNAATFRFGVYKSISKWDESPVAPANARRWAKISLCLWIALVFIGRATAFF